MGCNKHEWNKQCSLVRVTFYIKVVLGGMGGWQKLHFSTARKEDWSCGKIVTSSKLHQSICFTLTMNQMTMCNVRGGHSQLARTHGELSAGSISSFLASFSSLFIYRHSPKNNHCMFQSHQSYFQQLRLYANSANLSKSSRQWSKLSFLLPVLVSCKWQLKIQKALKMRSDWTWNIFWPCATRANFTTGVCTANVQIVQTLGSYFIRTKLTPPVDPAAH